MSTRPASYPVGIWAVRFSNITFACSCFVAVGIKAETFVHPILVPIAIRIVTAFYQGVLPIRNARVLLAYMILTTAYAFMGMWTYRVFVSESNHDLLMKVGAWLTVLFLLLFFVAIVKRNNLWKQES